MRHEPKSKTEEGANEKRGEERLKGEVVKMIGTRGGKRGMERQLMKDELDGDQ